MFSKEPQQHLCYHRIVDLFFSAKIQPGTKLVERTLATELGVSRIPVREALAKMVAEGILIGGQKGQGVRLRNYSIEEVHELYEYREMLEGGAARAAAKRATEMDLAKLALLCEQAETEIGSDGSVRWAEIDHRFHEALALATHNERFIKSLSRLLIECHYLFFLYPARLQRPRLTPQDASARMKAVLADHRTLLELLRKRDADGAERNSRAAMRQARERLTNALISSDLATRSEKKRM